MAKTDLERLEAEATLAFGPGTAIEIDSARVRSRTELEGRVWTASGFVLIGVLVDRAVGKAGLIRRMREEIRRAPRRFLMMTATDTGDTRPPKTY